ncbi:MAG: helix-turn-helix domain-containing protein [Victivallales bacterium]
MDAFSQKLDMLLLETKYRTSEELLQELKKNSTLEQAIDDIQIRNKQMAEELAKLREMAKTVELTKEDVSQLKEQTVGVPYFVDQDAKEARKDLQRINALKISLNLNEMELQILKFHDRGWTQSRIAAYLKVNVRTVQRHAAAIEEKYEQHNYSSPFTWNNRKKISEK